ncbi:MAG: hypothetical protein MJY95_01350 [Bacteroidaceae bacterium]|nr:hypothetical protein [Bacteroidaceae bacterium]
MQELSNYSESELNNGSLVLSKSEMQKAASTNYTVLEFIYLLISNMWNGGFVNGHYIGKNQFVLHMDDQPEDGPYAAIFVNTSLWGSEYSNISNYINNIYNMSDISNLILSDTSFNELLSSFIVIKRDHILCDGIGLYNMYINVTISYIENNVVISINTLWQANTDVTQDVYFFLTTKSQSFEDQIKIAGAIKVEQLSNTHCFSLGTSFLIRNNHGVDEVINEIAIVCSNTSSPADINWHHKTIIYS